MNEQRLIVLCDFDGTIIENDATDALLDSFGPSNWTDAGESYLAGEITHAQMSSVFASYLNATRSEIELELKKKAVLRSGFADFHQLLKNHNIPLLVVSGGWDVYIATVLSDLEFSFIEKLEDLKLILTDQPDTTPMIANRLVQDTHPKQWKVELPWLHASCQHSSPCKATFVEYLKGLGYTIIAIGNSETDMCMAEKADYVFATGGLPKILEKKDVSHTTFDSFSQIAEAVRSLT